MTEAIVKAQKETVNMRAAGDVRTRQTEYMAFTNFIFSLCDEAVNMEWSHEFMK